VTTNKFGLSRDIPSIVKREVRRRCKFGCVICRRGFYQYEHIDPFELISSHDPDRICCLCGSCHDAVTRGQLSKSAVDKAYRQISGEAPSDVEPPSGPLDFHTGEAHLMVGGLRYSPAVCSVLRYHGQDLIRVDPGIEGEPGSITAHFFDDKGSAVFQLAGNEWIGESINWDIEVKGARLSVRNPDCRVVLALRLEPPGTIVIERLDMRFGDGHILVSESSYAVGRYLGDDTIFWVHAELTITKAVPNARGIELTEPAELDSRIRALDGVGQYMKTGDGNFIFGSPIGVVCLPLGISIAHGCAVHFYGGGFGLAPINEVRKRVFLEHRDWASLFQGCRN
jgi:hypothetical protein